MKRKMKFFGSLLLVVLLPVELACQLLGVTRLPPVSWPKSVMATSSFSISVPAPCPMWQP